MQIKDYFRIGRAQTVPASALLMYTGLLLGGAELFSIFGVAMLGFSILFHIASFGQNSVMDSTIKPEIGEGYSVDESDENKSHHPIIDGSVSLREAFLSINTLLYALMVVASILPFITPGDTSYALFFFIVWIVMGQAYNNGMSVFTKWKWVYISTCFTGLILYFYFLFAQSFNTIIILTALYLFVRTWAQNGFEGEMKDLDAPENNMLEKLGARIGTGAVEEKEGDINFKIATDKFYPGYAGIYGFSLAIAEVNLFLPIALIIYSSLHGILPFTFLGVSVFSLIVGVHLTLKMCGERKWVRSLELKRMGLCEISFIYAIVILLAPVIGYLEVLALLLFGVAWFFGMNKFLWGKDHPDV